MQKKLVLCLAVVIGNLNSFPVGLAYLDQMYRDLECSRKRELILQEENQRLQNARIITTLLCFHRMKNEGNACARLLYRHFSILLEPKIGMYKTMPQQLQNQPVQNQPQKRGFAAKWAAFKEKIKRKR